MKVKYDPQATYVLVNTYNDAVRIFCEADNTSVLDLAGNQTDSAFLFKPNLKSIKDLVQYCDYVIVQEWK